MKTASDDKKKAGEKFNMALESLEGSSVDFNLESLSKRSKPASEFQKTESDYFKYYNVEGVKGNVAQNNKEDHITYACNIMKGKKGHSTITSDNEYINALMVSVQDSQEAVKSSLRDRLGNKVFILRERSQAENKRDSASTSGKPKKAQHKYGQITGVLYNIAGEGEEIYGIANIEKSGEEAKTRFYQYDENRLSEASASATYENVGFIAKILGVEDSYISKCSTIPTSKQSSQDLNEVVINEQKEDFPEQKENSPSDRVSPVTTKQLAGTELLVKSEGHENGAYANTNFRFIITDEGDTEKKALSLVGVIIKKVKKDFCKAEFMVDAAADGVVNDLIEYAVYNGGVSRILQKNGDQAVFVRNEEYGSDSVEVGFSREFQKLCKDCGIFSTINRADGDAAGMPLSRIPPGVLEILSKEAPNHDSDVVGVDIDLDQIINNRKEAVSRLSREISSKGAAK